MFAQILTTEFMKLRRNKVVWLSFVALSLGPLGIALLMWIVREPGRAASLGLLGAKANLSGLVATWPTYLTVLTQVIGVAGLLLLSFIVSYVFGREYTEGTAKNLLALPTGRHWFVLAKFVVVATWWALLVLTVLAEAFVIGFLLALPDFSSGLALQTVGNGLLAAGIAYLMAPIVAWIVTLGRGYLAPLGFALVMLALGNLFSKTGWGEWFPWSIVPLLIGAVGSTTESIKLGSVLVVVVTFLVGIGATIAQTRYADNTQ